MSQSKNAKYEEFRTYVKETCKEFKNLFLLNAWSMNWVFDEENEGEIENVSGTHKISVAEIETDVTYLTFTIIFYKGLYDYWKDGNKEAVTENLLHEFSHILFEPLDHIASEHIPPHLKKHYSVVIEQQTELTKNVLMNLKRSIVESMQEIDND